MGEIRSGQVFQPVICFFWADSKALQYVFAGRHIFNYRINNEHRRNQKQRKPNHLIPWKTGLCCPGARIRQRLFSQFEFESSSFVQLVQAKFRPKLQSVVSVQLACNPHRVWTSIQTSIANKVKAASLI